MAINNPIVKGSINIESGIGSSTQPLSNYKNLFFKQSRRGWLQNCLGCENKVEMRIATIENRDHDIMYAIEESDCIYRTCCPGHHPFPRRLDWVCKSGKQKIQPRLTFSVRSIN
jgi:hypothetical protein